MIRTCASWASRSTVTAASTEDTSPATTLIAPAAPDPAARPGSQTQGHNQC